MTVEETKTATDLLKEYNITPITIHHSYGYTYESVCELITKLLSDRDTHARQMAVEFDVWQKKKYTPFISNDSEEAAYRISTSQDYDTFTASTDRKEEVLICNDCKKFHIVPKSECECGCKTLTVTHESNRSLVTTDRKEETK